MLNSTLNGQRFFAATAKGVEQVLAEEMKTIGLTVEAVEKGGVRFLGDMADCYRANLWLRTASRILMPLTEFSADSPDSLYDGVRSVPWHRHLNPEMTLAVECNLRDSAMTHSGFVALKVKDAIVDAIRDKCGRRPNVSPRDPDLLVNVHLARNRCTVSLDTSGAGLDRRGYRTEAGVAPLRETLAAALVDLTGWNGTVPLVDPMCGSGTIVIEAALKALCRAPGLLRQFGFQRWPEFHQDVWRRIVDEARGVQKPSVSVPLMGYDRSARTLEYASRNCRRAGVERWVKFSRGDISKLEPPPQPGILLFNPPYGRRIGEEEELKTLYRQIGDVMKQRCAGYTAWLFTGSAELAKSVGLKASRRIVLYNGPLECRLLKYELY